MGSPKISIIMPIYNVERFLPDTIKSIQDQVFQDFEVICVDDGSTDHSADIIRRTAKKDSRFLLLAKGNAGAGAARNYGFLHAKGDYVIFLDSDDLFSPLLLDKLYTLAVENDADIATCNFSRFDEFGNIAQRKGIHTEWLPAGITVFNYQDCPHHIMSVVNPTPWNKLYKSDFIRKHNLKYEEITSSNDITFAAVSVATAERIAYITDSLVQYRIGHTGTISSTKTKNLNNVAIAVSSAVAQAKKLPYSDVIKDSILRFSVDNYLFALKQYITDFSLPAAEQFYSHVHKAFNGSDFDDITCDNLHNQDLYRAFLVIRKQDYATMLKLTSRKLIVSLTTYPGRIQTLGKVLNTIYAQSHPADEIILWLAADQFPNKEQDIPEDLLVLIREERLTLRWCEDLKPHKKYFYALQEFPDDLVVTIDDDLLYGKDMLDKLYRSYLMYPDAISTMRAHLIVISEQNTLLPYNSWIKETDACLHTPSMQLLATGGAGALYPPIQYRKEFFDARLIEEVCLWADDLWLKAMQLMSDVPVVVASASENLRYLPGSQTEALYHTNVDQNMNDIQLQRINTWMDTVFEPGILIRKLTTLNIGSKILGIEALCSHLDQERKQLKKELHRARMQKRSNDTGMQKQDVNNRKSVVLLGGAAYTNSAWQYRLIRFLAWLPAKTLGGLQCCLDHGFGYTIQYSVRKLGKMLWKRNA